MSEMQKNHNNDKKDGGKSKNFVTSNKNVSKINLNKDKVGNLKKK